MKKVLASLFTALIVFGCAPQEPAWSYSSHLVDEAWWAEDGCSNYKQLHFESDQTGWCFNENTCSCSGLIEFNWAISNDNILIITVTDAISCSFANDGYTETVILSEESFTMLGSNWHQ